MSNGLYVYSNFAIVEHAEPALIKRMVDECRENAANAVSDAVPDLSVQKFLAERPGNYALSNFITVLIPPMTTADLSTIDAPRINKDKTVFTAIIRSLTRLEALMNHRRDNTNPTMYVAADNPYGIVNSDKYQTLIVAFYICNDRMPAKSIVDAIMEVYQDYAKAMDFNIYVPSLNRKKKLEQQQQQQQQQQG